MVSDFVRRVDQLDAINLDDELFSLLNIHYRKALQYIPNSFLIRFGPELDVLFKVLFKYLPLRNLGSSVGQHLFQLQYKDTGTHQEITESKLRLLVAIGVCLPWFWERVVRKYIFVLFKNGSARRAFNTSFALENQFYVIYKILSLINFCIFLQRSSFPTVTERMLNVRPLYTTQQDIQQMEYSGVSRELLWHGLSELLGFSIPFINVYRVKGMMKRSLFKLPFFNGQKKYLVDLKQCGICSDIPNFPHTIGCSHVFCYYCIASHVMADPSYLCIECDVKANGLDNIKPVSVNEMK